MNAGGQDIVISYLQVEIVQFLQQTAAYIIGKVGQMVVIYFIYGAAGLFHQLSAYVRFLCRTVLFSQCRRHRYGVLEFRNARVSATSKTYSRYGLPLPFLCMSAMPFEPGLIHRRMVVFHSSILAQAVAFGRWAYIRSWSSKSYLNNLEAVAKYCFQVPTSWVTDRAVWSAKSDTCCSFVAMYYLHSKKLPEKESLFRQLYNY